MRKTGTLRRTLASLLALCMLLTLLPVSALAEEGGKAVTVAAFEALDGAVAEQTVPFGTAREALNLPGTLRAAVYTTARDTEAAVIDGVTWEPDAPYEGAAGRVTFTASAEGYVCADGVEWPVVTVTVEEQPAPEPAPYDEAVALFAALPGGVQTMADTPTPTADVGKKTIYANGAPLLLRNPNAVGDRGLIDIYIDNDGSGTVTDGDTHFRPNGNATMSDDLSEWTVYGGSYDTPLTGDTKIIMTGGIVKHIYGGGETENAVVNGNTTVSIPANAEVTGNVYGGGNRGNVTGSTTVTIGDWTVANVYGGNGTSGSVGSTSVTIHDIAEVTGSVYGGGKVTIGGSSSGGVVINGGDVTNGVDSFVIDPDLKTNARVNVNLPAGYAGGTIATGAVEADLAKITLVGDGAEGNEAYFDSHDNVIKVRAKVTMPTPTAVVADKRIFANGAPLLLAAGSENADYTVVYIDKDGSGTVTDGDAIFDIDGDGTDYDGTAAGNDLSAWFIYGGCENVPLTADTSLTMLGGKVNWIYGGGFAVYNASIDNKPGWVIGNTSVTFEGGTVKDSVFGGGGGDLAAVNGNTSVTVSGTAAANRVYGGGYGGTVTGDTSVTISGGTATGNIHGGGNGSSSAVTGRASILVTDGNLGTTSYGSGNLYGGALYGTVGNVSIRMTGGTVNGIFGSGKEPKGTYAVEGSSSIDISGGTVKNNIYGGGKVSGDKTVTVGGGACIGNAANRYGVQINGGSFRKTDGVASFVIGDDLTGEDGCIVVVLPAGYDVSSNPTIATAAVAGDLAKIKLTGDNVIPTTAEGKEAFFEDSAIKVRAVPPAWAGGTGTESSPYRIATYEQLEAFAARVSGGSDYSGTYIQLAHNFPTDSGPLTTPIGTFSAPFQGHFDGNNQTVDLNINVATACAGLFGCVSSGGVVENVTVTGTVQSTDSSVGGVVGEAYSEVTVRNCVNSATITGKSNVGGVVGYTNNMVENCRNTGAVSGTDYCVGGVVGYSNGGTVQRCQNTGAVTGAGDVGGVVGANNRMVQNCYNTGTVAGKSAGGVVGTNQHSGGSTTVQNCYNTGTVTGQSAGGVVCSNLGLNEPSIKNCLSLGLTVTAAGSSASRVASDGASLSANQARADMKVYQNTTEAVTPESKADGIHGADLAVDGSVTVADAFSGWDTGVWTIPAETPLTYGCDLPTLTGSTPDPVPTLPTPHTHAMSVDCSTAEGEQVTFDKVLTAADTSINASGNYYLAEDVTIENNCLTVTGANVTVNLCLNGHTLTAGNADSNVIQVVDGATLHLCDCKPEAENNTALTDPTTGESATVTGGLITGGKTHTSGIADSTIAVAGASLGTGGTEHAALHLYGGTVAGNVSENCTVDVLRGSFTLHGGRLAYNTSDYGCVSVSQGADVAIAGGAIEHNHATENRGAVYLSGNADASLTLSGQPVIRGNTRGTEKAPGAIYLREEWVDNKYRSKTIAIGENFAPTEKIGVSTEMTPTQESPVPITGANGADYSRYFKSDNDAYVIQNGENNVVQLRVKSDDATLSALAYTVGGGTATDVPGFAAETATYTVALPADTAATAVIALTGTPAAGASITTNEGVTLANGSGSATVTVTAEDGTTTKTYTVNFVTMPAAPAATEAVIDYSGETLSFDASTLEMNTKADFTGTEITSGAGITDYISDYGTAAQTLYIRVKKAGETPASAATAVTIPARPRNPYPLQNVSAGPTHVNASDFVGEEYTVDNWSTSKTSAFFTGLNPGTVYTLRARMAATATSFKGAETSKEVRTLTAFAAPTGAEEGKGGVSADENRAAVGDTVTYTVTFADGWTPTLTLSGNSNTLSGPVRGDHNTWTYTYTVHENDKTVGAAVTFAPRQVAGVSYTGDGVTLFADSEHNATADALKAELNANAKVTPTYDNGTTGEDVSASYELKSGSTWNAKGGAYIYTATVNGATCEVPVTVKAVNAVIGPVDGITKVRRTEGYASHAALSLPGTVTVTCTGEGYAQRTDALAVSWSAIPADFGKNPGSNDFTGTVTLPAWATGSNTTTATVTISDKTVLTDSQMTLNMEGWTYGGTANTPEGSVTVTGDNGVISYQYSADSGATWPDSLPRSTGGFTKTGDYLVKMSYEGDAYIGEKTAEFTVAQKAVTLDVGTLAATKPYDGGTDAILTGAPAVTGALDGDAVTATGGSGTYARLDVGENIPVAVTGFTLTGADAGNYTTGGTVSGLTGTITPADGKTAPEYAAALESLKAVHIVTNVTPTLEGVALPTGWDFTGDKTARITAKNENEGKQPFPVRYTPESTNYAPVTLTDFAFPVSTVALDVNGGLDMRTIESIDGTLTLSPVALKVTGAALPTSGDYAITNMEWSSSVKQIATVTGSVAASNMTAAITAHDKGVTMVGVAYRNGGGMLGYVLVQVVGDRTDSANTAADLTTITETLDKLIDPQSPSETDKKAVDAVADEVTKLPDAVKEALTLEDVKTLDELKQAVGENISDGDKKLTITIEDDPEGQAPAPENVSVVGAAIACGVSSGDVVVTVKPVPPSGSDTKLELKMEMTVGGAETQLAAPMFFQMDVPEGIDLENLKLYHVKDHGSKTELSYEKGKGRTIAFKMMSFSSVQFVVSTGGTAGGSTTYYTLTATAGEGGSISPSGNLRVARNSGKTFTVAPDEGYEIADVLVDGNSVGAVSSYTFESVTANHTIAASFRAEGERPAWNPFTDIKEGAWYYDSVKYVYERGLMNGTGKTTFSPGLSTTRGMIVTILWRLEQSPESSAAMAFTDVKAGRYCYEAVRWAAEHEIVKGYTPTTFGPDNTITRQELAAVLYRYAQYKGADMSAVGGLTAFTDHPDPWAEDAVKWAVGEGILAGRGNGVLDPRGRATRAEAAAMLTRFISAKVN